MTIHISNVWNQKMNYEFPLEALDQMKQQEFIIEPCKRYRETGELEDKKKLLVLLASDRHFFIDIDGANHVDGNSDVDIDKIIPLVPHVAWFKSPSGKGLKLLLEVNRDCITGERATISKHLLDTIHKQTGSIVDNCRTDIAFVSDYPVTFSNQIFQIPDKFEKYIKAGFTGRADHSSDVGQHSRDLRKLAELLDNCPVHSGYYNWLAIVMAVLRLYGESAIPLLENKWYSEVPYNKLMEYAYKYSTDILDIIWDRRIRRNATIGSRKYSRRVITGATGAGKSQFAINEMRSQFFDYNSELFKYAIYVVPSTKQAIDFSLKLDQAGISYEILVSSQTYDTLDAHNKSKVVTSSCNKKSVKIIMLAALKRNSHWNMISRDKRKLCNMYIDELTFLEFVRPSLYTQDLSYSYSGIKTSSELLQHYKKSFSKSDLKYAENLLAISDNNHFVSSMLYQDVDTTVLTTEELTTECLEAQGFIKTIIRSKETSVFKNTCTLHVSESPYYVLKCVESELFQKQIDEIGYDNVFANKCKFASGNLVTIKGQHITGKNLSIIRCLPRENVGAIDDLFKRCFWNLEHIDPVSLFYKDSLMQAVGRSIGFRGHTEAWVMIHSTVWKMIKDTEWIYKLNNWSIELDPDLLKEIDEHRFNLKSIMSNTYELKAQFVKNEKAKRIEATLVVTGNPKDVLLPKDIKQIFGTGYTLKEVASCFNLTPSRTKSKFFIKGIKQI